MKDIEEKIRQGWNAVKEMCQVLRPDMDFIAEINNLDAVEFLIGLTNHPLKEKWMKFHKDNIHLMVKAKGSSHNHQAWPGGYYHHVKEGMNICVTLYHTFCPWPFSQEQALIAFYFHDLEKMYKYSDGIPDGWDKRKFLKDFGLSPEELHAVEYVHGELLDYRSDTRVMSELAAFVHVADIMSARIWHDRPLDKSLPQV